MVNFTPNLHFKMYSFENDFYILSNNSFSVNKFFNNFIFVLSNSSNLLTKDILSNFLYFAIEKALEMIFFEHFYIMFIYYFIVAAITFCNCFIDFSNRCSS